MPATVIACCFGLFGFAATTVVGAAAGLPVVAMLWRALWMTAICYAVGWAAGATALRAVERHLAAYREANPLPEIDSPDASPAEEAVESEAVDSEEADDADEAPASRQEAA